MRLVVLAAVAALWPLCGLAQAPAQAFRALLSALPDPTGLPRLTVQFGDPDLARQLDLSAVEGARTDPGTLGLRGLPMGLFMALLLARDGAPTAAGFGLADARQILHLGAIPDQATIIDLAPGAGAAVPPALAAMGYILRQERGVTAWGLGDEPEGRQPGRRAERNRDDPFRAVVGRMPRVRIEGDRIIHAEGSAMMMALTRGVGGSILARSEVVALVDALDLVPDAGGLVQAMLWPDMAPLTTTRPADLVPGLDPAAEWRGVLLADLTTGPQSTGVLALAVTLPDQGAAQALADRLVRAWAEAPIRGDRPDTLADRTGGLPGVRLHPAGAGLWVVVLHRTQPTEVSRSGASVNPAFMAILGATSRGGLHLLQP